MVLSLTEDPQGGGDPIPAAQAKKLIKKYVDQATERTFGFQAGEGVNAAIAFDEASLNRVLGQPGCKGIRLYFGIEPPEQNLNALVIIVVGIDDKGNDIGFDANGNPLNLKAEETGTNTKSLVEPDTLTNRNRAFLLEYALKP